MTCSRKNCTPTFISSTASRALRLGADAAEAVIDLRVGQRRGAGGEGAVGRVPGDGGVHVGEGALADHEGLAAAALFAGTAVVAHGAFQSLFLHDFFQRRGGGDGGDAEQVVPAAVPVAAGDFRFPAVEPRLLAQPGQRVELAEEGDHGAAFAPLAAERRFHAADVVRDAEALFFKQADLRRHRTALAKSRLRVAPDLVGRFGVTGAAGLDDLADFFLVHGTSLPSENDAASAGPCRSRNVRGFYYSASFFSRAGKLFGSPRSGRARR